MSKSEDKNKALNSEGKNGSSLRSPGLIWLPTNTVCDEPEDSTAQRLSAAVTSGTLRLFQRCLQIISRESLSFYHITFW